MDHSCSLFKASYHPGTRGVKHNCVHTEGRLSVWSASYYSSFTVTKHSCGKTSYFPNVIAPHRALHYSMECKISLCFNSAQMLHQSHTIYKFPVLSTPWRFNCQETISTHPINSLKATEMWLLLSRGGANRALPYEQPPLPLPQARIHMNTAMA